MQTTRKTNVSDAFCFFHVVCKISKRKCINYKAFDAWSLDWFISIDKTKIIWVWFQKYFDHIVLVTNCRGNLVKYALAIIQWALFLPIFSVTCPFEKRSHRKTFTSCFTFSLHHHLSFLLYILRFELKNITFSNLVY